MATKSNIMKSGAKFFWSTSTSEALPDETTVAAGAAWGGGWTDLGYTSAPLTITYASTEAEAIFEQAPGPIARRKTGESLVGETTLGEVTASNLNYAVGGTSTVSTTAAGASQKGYEQVSIGGSFTTSEGSWGVEGEVVDSAGNIQPMRFFGIGTLNVNGALELSARGDSYTGVPIQVKALADTGNSNRLMVHQRVTANATS